TPPTRSPAAPPAPPRSRPPSSAAAAAPRSPAHAPRACGAGSNAAPRNDRSTRPPPRRGSSAATSRPCARSRPRPQPPPPASSLLAQPAAPSTSGYADRSSRYPAASCDRLDIGQLGNERVPEDAAVLGQVEAIAGGEQQDVGIVLVDCHGEAGRQAAASFAPCPPGVVRDRERGAPVDHCNDGRAGSRGRDDPRQFDGDRRRFEGLALADDLLALEIDEERANERADL